MVMRNIKQEEYDQYKDEMNKLGNELGKFILKVLESEKYREWNYADVFRIFLIASNHVNENLHVQWLRNIGRIEDDVTIQV